MSEVEHCAVPRVPILMYHSIGGTDRLAVRPEAFAEQLAHLADQGYTPVTFGDLLRWTAGPVAGGTPADRGAAAVSGDAGAYAGRPAEARPSESTLGPAGGTGGGPGRPETPATDGGEPGGPDAPAADGDRAGRPARPVVLTFDDGYADFRERVLPLLARYGFPATLFVTTGWLRDAGPYAAGRPLGRTLSWGELEEVAAAGVEIGGHGHAHAQLDQLGDRALREELRLGRALLEARLGRPVRAMAYPYGYSSARVRRAVRDAGYTAACAVANTLPEAGHDVLAVPRLTVRATTSIAAFARALDGRGYLVDHALTKGYAVVRRSRRTVRRLRGAT